LSTVGIDHGAALPAAVLEVIKAADAVNAALASSQTDDLATPEASFDPAAIAAASRRGW